jgi:urease beta subunit
MRNARVLLFLFIFCALKGLAANPTLFFTDLTSGPVGAIVTVYGANLVPTVTLNQVSASVIASSATKVSFVVPAATSGSITVGNSNALPFTVRTGNIYYVATNGSDSNPGSASAPWATIPNGFNTAQCGDIVYVMDGVMQTATDNYGASLSVQRICSEANPLALVGYPGATVTIGSVNGAEYGIRNPDINGDGYNGMVFANLVIRANNTGIKDTGNLYWRIVGNDFSCPYGSGEAACAMMDQASNIQFLGNTIHDTGAGGTKYYHSFYATTNSNNIEVGWNNIYNNQSCRGIQFYSTSGSPQYNLIVHDNVVTGQECDGINFSTVDATLGPIEAYNNVVYHVGLGGTNDGIPNYACIASLGYGNPGGSALFYGNTLADCGPVGGNTAGAITVLTGSPQVLATSNLVIQNPGEVVYSPNSSSSLVTANSDVLLTNGTAGVVNSLYQLVAGSPAIGAGTAYAGILYDLAGNPRPQAGASDAGALLYSSIASAPAVSLSASSLAFGNQMLNITSAAQSVKLTNSGNAALTIGSIALTGANASSFSISNNCGASLASGANCTIQVTFLPLTAGSFTASITLTDSAANSPQSVALSGTGSNSTLAVSLSASSLAFGNQALNTTSAAKAVTVTNTGSAALTIGSIALTGANASSFSISNNCGASLASGANCTIQVKFVPLTAGSLTASITLTDSAANSPQTVALSGTGTSSTVAVSLSATSLAFGNQALNTTSAAKAVTVTNTGSAALTIGSIALTGTNASSFSISNNCGTSLASGANCTIQVKFVPSTAGSLTASITLTDSAANSPQTVALSGTGTSSTVAGPAYTLTASPASLTLTAGQTATVTIQMIPTGGFAGTVALSCANLPSLASCQIKPATLIADGSNTILTAQMMLTTQGPSVATVSHQESSGKRHFALASISLLPSLMLGIWLSWKRRTLRGKWNVILLAMLGLSLCALGGCGTSFVKTAAGAYTVTVTGVVTGANSAYTGPVSQTTQVYLVVNN